MKDQLPTQYQIAHLAALLSHAHPHWSASDLANEAIKLWYEAGELLAKLQIAAKEREKKALYEGKVT